MNKYKVILFAAELIAVVLLRLTVMLRKDNSILPKGAKLGIFKGRPIFRTGFFKPKPAKPTVASMSEELHDITGWTPPPRRGKLDDPREQP